MPGWSTGKPVAFDRDAISSWVFVPSVNSHRMRGFMFLALASSRTSSITSVGRFGLFLPLPVATTVRPRSSAYSTSLRHSVGSSPRQMVYTCLPALAMLASSSPTVTSASTVISATSFLPTRAESAIWAAISGTPDTSSTMSTGSFGTCRPSLMTTGLPASISSAALARSVSTTAGVSRPALA